MPNATPLTSEPQGGSRPELVRPWPSVVPAGPQPQSPPSPVAVKVRRAVGKPLEDEDPPADGAPQAGEQGHLDATADLAPQPAGAAPLPEHEAAESKAAVVTDKDRKAALTEPLGRSKAVQPQAVHSEAVQSEAVHSEAVHSEAVQSEAVQSEAVQSEAVPVEDDDGERLAAVSPPAGAAFAATGMAAMAASAGGSALALGVTHVVGSIFMGPMKPGNGLYAILFDDQGQEIKTADGRSSRTKVDDQGRFRIDIQHSGVVMVQVVDEDPVQGNKLDYEDEVSGSKDMEMDLRLTTVIPLNALQHEVSITGLSELGVRKVLQEPSPTSTAPGGTRVNLQGASTDVVQAANAEIAKAFGLSGSVDQLEVKPTVDANGLATSNANAAGRVAALMAGLDALLGTTQALATLSQSLAGGQPEGLTWGQLLLVGAAHAQVLNDLVSDANAVILASRTQALEEIQNQPSDPSRWSPAALALADFHTLSPEQLAKLTAEQWKWVTPRQIREDLSGPQLDALVTLSAPQWMGQPQLAQVQTTLTSGTLQGTLQGHLPAGAQVEVLDAGQVIGVATVTDHSWRYELTQLSEVTHRYQVRVRLDNSATTSSASATLAVLVDHTPPVADLLKPGSFQPEDQVQVQSSEAGQAYLVRADAAIATVADILALADAQWNQVGVQAGVAQALSLAGLASGEYRLYAADGLGNLSAGSAQTVKVDGLPPSVTLISSGSFRPEDQVQVQSSEAGQAYLVRADAAIATVADILALADAQWNQVGVQAGVAQALSLAGLASGEYRLYAADGLGNLSAGSAQTVKVVTLSAVRIESVHFQGAHLDQGQWAPAQTLQAGDRLTVGLFTDQALTGWDAQTDSVTISVGGQSRRAYFQGVNPQAPAENYFGYTITPQDVDDLDGVSLLGLQFGAQVHDSQNLPFNAQQALPAASTPPVLVNVAVPEGQLMAAARVSAQGHVDFLSSELGMAYLVSTQVNVQQLTDITNADTSLWNGANAQASVQGQILTNGLRDGFYRLYVADGMGAFSLDAAHTVEVDGTAPQVTLQSSGSVQKGVAVTVQSSETGTIFLVSQSASVTTLAQLMAVPANQMVQAPSTSANSAVGLGTAGLDPGVYVAYAVDAVGNLSLVSGTSVQLVPVPVTPPSPSTDTWDVIGRAANTMALKNTVTNGDHIEVLFTSVLALSGLSASVDQVMLQVGSLGLGASYVGSTDAHHHLFRRQLAGLTDGDVDGVTITSVSFSEDVVDSSGQPYTPSGYQTVTLDTFVDVIAPQVYSLNTVEPITPQGTVVFAVNESGTAYLVHDSVQVSTPQSIEQASTTLWNSLSFSQAHGNLSLSAAGLVDGQYKLYTADEAGNLSQPFGQTVEVDGTRPVIAAVNFPAWSGDVLRVRSNELGAAYLVKDAAGTQWSSRADIEALSSSAYLRTDFWGVNAELAVDLNPLNWASGTAYHVYVADRAGNLSAWATGGQVL